MKLATLDGQNLARQRFDPGIYKGLYEVDMLGEDGEGNEVYQYYKRLIPDHLDEPEDGIAVFGIQTYYTNGLKTFGSSCEKKLSLDE